MSKEFEELLRETEMTYAQMLGGGLTQTSDAKEVAEALGQARTVILSLRWQGAQHQFVLDSIDAEGRIHFFNSRSDRSLPPGSELGGQDGTPPRRVEDGAHESITADILKLMLDTGHAVAQIVTPRS